MPLDNPGTRRARARLLVMTLHCVIVASLLVACGGGNTPEPTSTPAPTVMPTGTPLPTVQPRTPTPAASPKAVAPRLPGTATPISELSGNQCKNDCLIRLPYTDHLAKELADQGERPSYVVDKWMWAVVPAPVVKTLLDEHTSIALVQDSGETWPIYVTKQKSGTEPAAEVKALGAVLDFVNGYTVVKAKKVTPPVSELVGAGHAIEKMAPAPPPATEIAKIGRQGPIRSVSSDSLLKQVDQSYLLEQIKILQGTSSNDGTGIGTRHQSQPGNAIAAEHLYTTLERMGLKVWYQDFITWEGRLCSNVIGEIPGKDTSKIYAGLAHLDSINESDFSSSPGADDNATGIASNLMIAKVLSQYNLEHPVRILFVNAEETSIVGSMALAEEIARDKVPIEGIFNIDTVGNPGFGNRLVLNSGPQSAWMSELLVRLNNQYGLGQQIEVHQTEKIVADDNMFRNEGIEAVLLARLLAGQYGVQHTEKDTLGNMSIELVIPVCQLVLLALAALVDGQ